MSYGRSFWVVSLLCGVPQVALGFGGVFTSIDLTTIPEPLDTKMARVVFEVDDGAITAHVQLSFDGSPRHIAWVLPVEEVPVVEDGSLAFFDELDAATRLGVKMPASEPCLAPDTKPVVPEGGCSCGEQDAPPAIPTPLSGPESEHPPIIHYGDTMTGTYRVRTVGASTSDNLIAWLDAEGFSVSANMAPAMDAYNRFGMKFVVIQFNDDSPYEDTPPLTLRYPGTQPVVPLQLTAIAARPQFSLLVTILANDTYTPENFVTVAPSPSDLLYDDAHHVSYFDWVARTAAQSNGHLFVPEYVGESPFAVGAIVGGVEIRHTYLSRFFTRISADEMDEDARFRVHPDPTYRARPEIDLVREPSLYRCNELVEERLPAACAFNYCGATGACAVVDGRAGCLCEAGDVAETVTGPDGQVRVVCAARTNEFGFVDETQPAPDPCAGVSCGEGACIAKHGRATCDCLPGMVATLVQDRLTCAVAPDDLETYGPGGGIESRPITMAAVIERGAVYAGAAWIVVLLLLGVRRQR